MSCTEGKHTTQLALTPINYQLFPDTNNSNVNIQQWLRDYEETLFFTMSIATFQKERFYKPSSRASQLLAMLAIIISAQTALLLLFAIRRRFKR